MVSQAHNPVDPKALDSAAEVDGDAANSSAGHGVYAGIPRARRLQTSGTGAADAALRDTAPSLETEIVEPVPPPTPVPPRPFRRTLLRQWEGTVLVVHGGEFTARLRPLGQGEVEVAEFDVDDLSAGDREKLAPGAVFYWNIGWRTWNHGQREKYSELVFRGFPLLTRAGLRALDGEEDAFRDLFAP